MAQTNRSTKEEHMKTKAICFLDTETTGLIPRYAEVIEVAMIRREHDGEETRFHSLIKPERIENAHPRALEVNGYAADPTRWDDAPLMEEIGHEIADFCRGSVLCGHNIAFDESMIAANFRRSEVRRRIPIHKIETMTLAWEHLVPLGLARVSLDSIRAFLGWSTENAHTAMKDTEDVLRLFDLLWRMTPERLEALTLAVAGDE